MKMKTRIHIAFWITTAVMLLSACHDPKASDDGSISFSAINDNLSNKSILVENLLHPGSTFRVYADFNRSEGSIHPVFRGTEVGFTAEGIWEYNPIEYWMSNGSYDFRAVWPASADIVHTNSDGKSINVQNYSVVSDNAYDLMVAYVYRDMTIKNDISTVNMVFRHALAAVNVIARKEADDPQQYTLKNTYFKNMYVAGNFIFSGNPATPEALSDCWNKTYFQSSACLTQEHNSIVNTSGNAPVYQFVIPQEINAASMAADQKAKLCYTLVINNNEVITEAEIPYIEWLPGKIYTYRVNLKASGADIEIVTSEWDKVDVTADDIIGSL